MVALDVNQTALAPRHELARRGLRVFPLVSNSKRPAVDAWPTKASAQPAAVEDLWAKARKQDGDELNTAVATGQGLLVLDLDTKNGQQGLQSRFVLETMGLPDTLEATTPTGGAHLYLRTPAHLVIPNSVGRIMPGVDVRCRHGYVVAPGSTINGVAYEWVDPDQPIADAPDWLVTMCMDTNRERQADHREPLGEIDTPDALARGAEWLQTQAPEAIEGDHGDITTFKVAARLKDFGIGIDEAHRLMVEHWNGDKAIPPWDTDDLMAKVESAFNSGRNRPGSANAAAQFGVVEILERPRPTSDHSRTLLPIITASDLAGKPVPPRPWHVENWIPGRNVTQLSGDGGTGKSAIALQLAVATALGRDWLGLPVTRGRVLYLSAEDELDEVHRRLAEICDGIGADLGQLSDVRVSPLAGEDAILAAPEDRSSILKPTKLWHRLEQEIADWPPKLLLIDTQSDVFAGMENDRAQARQFVGMLRQLALRYDPAVVLCSHPSLTGLNSGTGTSGSTGWNNSVRSRIYLSRVQAKDGSEHDPDLRVLSTKKLNYGRLGQEIRLRWTMGVFCPADTAASQQAVAEEQERIDRVFLELLAAYEAEGRTVGSAPSAIYAPTLFAKDSRAKGVSKKGLTDSMNRLFASGRIRAEEYGPPSKRRSKLVAS
jgi:RecA-family ATPase